MRAWLEIQFVDRTERVKLTPKEGYAEGDRDCPDCGKKAPLQVKGSTPTRLPDNRTIRSNGHTVCCDAPVGYLFVRPSTIFGLEEDQRMLEGRARVY